MPHRWTDVPVRPGDRRNVRRSYLVANAFEAMLSVAAIVSGFGLLTSPAAQHGASANAVLGDWAQVLAVMLVVGGGMTLGGLLRPDVRAEVAGLALVAGAILANAFALVAVRHLVGLPTACMYVGWAFACCLRIRLVLRLARIVVVARR